MCEDCDKAIATALDEISKLASGEVIDATASDPDGWAMESKMGLVISRAAVVIQKGESHMAGAPLSIIIGTIAGIAMEAEVMGGVVNEALDMLRATQNPN